MKQLIVAVCSVVLLSPLFVGTAVAQDDGGKRRAKLVIDSGVLVGKIRKPSVQFLISREKGINQEAIELKESFVPKILDSVNEVPF